MLDNAPTVLVLVLVLLFYSHSPQSSCCTVLYEYTTVAHATTVLFGYILLIGTDSP